MLSVRKYLVYCGWLIIELVFVVAFIVETRGRTLEETAALFDGEQQPQDLIDMGGEAATMTMSRGAADLILREREEKSLPADFMEMHEYSNSDSAGSLDRELRHELEMLERERYLYRMDSKSDSMIQAR